MKWLGTVENPTDDIAGGEKVVSQAATRFHNGSTRCCPTTTTAASALQSPCGTPGVKNPVLVGEGGTPDAIAA